MPTWVDYKTLREELKFEDLLKSYNINVKAKKGQYRGPCPLPECRDAKCLEPTFSANLEKGIWQCFRCGAKGNQVEFGVIMEGFNPDDRKEFRKGALILAKRFGLARENRNKKYRKPRDNTSQGCVKPSDSVVEEVVNPPLAFALRTLDSSHPWFRENGLKPETVEHFGLGYCSRGFLKGRIAVPLHNLDGQLIGYAGMLLDAKQVRPNVPLLRFPETKNVDGVRQVFDPAIIIYNVHRLSDDLRSLIVCHDFLSLWRLWEDGCGNVVCLPSDGSRILDEYFPSAIFYELTEHRG